MSAPDINQLQGDAKAGKPEAQFLLSQLCFKNNDLEGMIHWLSLASAAGLSAAQEAYGYCFEKGRGISQDFDQAIRHYDYAIAQGAHLAAFRKAELLYKSSRGVSSASTITELLTTAANANFLFSPVPLPAALPLMGSGLALLGFMGWRKKRKAA